MSAPETAWRAWLAKAGSDALNIQNNLAAVQVPWDTVCYHAQQAVEKTLKAYLVFHRRPLLRTHDLVALLAACCEVEPALAELDETCRRLNAFAVEARYPSDIYEPTEPDAREAVAALDRVRRTVLAFLPRSQA
jgi:HEPN domain-containing protein